MLKIIKEEIETKLKEPTIAKNKYTNLEKNHKSAFKHTSIEIPNKK